MTRSAVIVQARFGSTRLPGKVLLPLQGRTVLSHVVERCSRVDADMVVCAIPHGVENDRVAAEAEHVTPWMRRHARRRVNLWGPGGADAERRITLDTPGDYEIIKAVVEGERIEA